VRIAGVERHKGKARILFSAGRRARRELFDEAAVLRALATAFTCGVADVPNGVDRLRRELSGEREGHGWTRARLAEAWAERLVEGAIAREARGGIVAAVLDGAGVDLLRAVAARIVSDPARTAVLAGGVAAGEDARPVVIERGSSARVDCGGVMKALAAQCAGRGGGRADRAEGRVSNVESWEATIAALTTTAAS
jgi:alanyl-tRNA synthetase